MVNGPYINDLAGIELLCFTSILVSYVDGRNYVDTGTARYRNDLVIYDKSLAFIHTSR